MNLSPAAASVRRIIAEISPFGRIVLNISYRGRGTKFRMQPSLDAGWMSAVLFVSNHELALKAQDNESRRKRAGWLLPRTNLHIPQTGRPVCFEGLHVSRVNLVSHIQWRLWRQGRGDQTPSRALRCCSCHYFNELCYSILVWRHHRVRVRLVCMCGFKLQEMNPTWR